MTLNTVGPPRRERIPDSPRPLEWFTADGVDTLRAGEHSRSRATVREHLDVVGPIGEFCFYVPLRGWTTGIASREEARRLARAAIDDARRISAEP